MSELLDEASRALRETTARGADTETLERIFASLDGEERLDEAAAAWRAESAEDHTLSRIHRTLAGARPPRRTHAAWAAIAAALVAAIAVPSAWAWTSSARLAWPLGPTEVHEHQKRAAPRPMPAIRIAPPPAPPAPVVDPPSTPIRAARRAPARDAESLLFADAHRAHIERSDPAAVVAAYDAYLTRFPRGRYEPEARYNRALNLVRLGRHAQARSALASFARGVYGSYRRDEAAQLVEALDAREERSP